MISNSSNPKLLACRDIILETVTVYQITFVEDILSDANIVNITEISQSGLSALSRSVNTVSGTLKVRGENRETNHLKNFNNTNKVIFIQLFLNLSPMH